jgi:glycine/D-amino acid oxidase-like deaminating enzyme
MIAERKIVICGAGIAGVAAAYHLAIKHGVEDVTLIDKGHPLSLTSDKSTEAYRNWWPGPDWQMTAFMDRSIDLMEEIARETDNRINLNRRGYLFATADAGKITFLETMAKKAEERGAGAARIHTTASSAYEPAQLRGFDSPITGADIITDKSLIRRHFPYLSPGTIAVAHVRRAGWLSAQQLGAVMLEAVRGRGIKVVRGEVVGIGMQNGRACSVDVAASDSRRTLDATDIVLAGGPHQKQLAALAGIDLPIVAERHRKVSFQDTRNAMPREAPMMIWLDEQYLPFTDEEREALSGDSEAQHFLDKFPAGVHGRPDGAAATLLLFNHHGDPVEPTFPLPDEPHYAEIALRGMATMVPALKAYNGRPSRPYIDGGYYMRTKENRPLIGPTSIEGLHISCGFGGFGVMAACASGELAAAHIMRETLPAYAPAFLLSRYQDPQYRALLESWGDGGQL